MQPLTDKQVRSCRHAAWEDHQQQGWPAELLPDGTALAVWWALTTMFMVQVSMNMPPPKAVALLEIKKELVTEPEPWPQYMPAAGAAPTLRT